MTPARATPQKQFSTLPEFVWEGPRDRVVLSALAGGRVISWRRGSHGELVKPPDVIDGGLLRVQFGEERYPGASHVTPHFTRVVRNDERGFEVHLRGFLSTSNSFARFLGWPEKVNPSYLDGLWLDKTVTFDAADAVLAVDFGVSNLTGETRRLSPWLHNQFQTPVAETFVASNGRQQPYRTEDIWWAGHPPRPGESFRLIHVAARAPFAIVLGADTGWLAGMVSHTDNDGCMELRGQPVTLPPGQRWRATAFLALTEDWQKWARESPVALTHGLEPACNTDFTRNPPPSLLEHWALPEERARGVMVLSYLDKVPFTSGARYAAANSFAGFHRAADGERACATAWVVASHPVTARLAGDGRWQLREREAGGLIELSLEGPADLAGKENVVVRVEDVVLRVEPDAVIGARYDFQVKQTSTYLDERWRAEKGGFPGTTATGFADWQQRCRGQLRRWMADAALGPAPLSPRLMERQVGPHCVREKILIQTEADMWLPMYLVRPKDVTGKLPALLFPHGSGPGKLHFAPDETERDQDPATFDSWPSPYAFAHQFQCLVLIPDRRGWGEWSEANHGQRHERAWRAGYNIVALDMWDHCRAIDYLASRPDVDARRIVSLGSSGGGWVTMFMLAADERIAGGIVSSSVANRPGLPVQYFFQTFPDEPTAISPPPHLPLAPATLLCLAAPRPLWIMDGKWDRGVLPALPHTKEEAKAAFARWHAEANDGRDEVARIYRLLGAEENFQATWFEGDHLAGFTFHNIAAWMRRHVRSTKPVAPGSAEATEGG